MADVCIMNNMSDKSSRVAQDDGGTTVCVLDRIIYYKSAAAVYRNNTLARGINVPIGEEYTGFIMT